MKTSKQWSTLKKIIGRHELRKDNFLSIIDKKGNIVCANATMVKTLDLQPPRLTKTNFFTLLHPEHVDTFLSAIRDSRKKGNPGSAELYLKNGYYHPMKWQVSYLDKIPGSSETYLCVGYKLNDNPVEAPVVDMRQDEKIIPESLEKQLEEANDRLLLLSRATSDAIWEWDMQTGYIFRNDALMNMIGYQAENRKGLSWWLRRIHPDDRNRVTDKIKDATDKGQQSWEEKYMFKCADGIYKHIHDRGYVVYENGLPVKMIGSLHDISDLKNLEDKLVEEKLKNQKELSETVIRVQEVERNRIGHELHDNVNQILATTKLFVDMLTPSSKTEKHAKEKSLEYILMAVEEIRKLSKELVVPQLKGEGLVDSIHGLVDDIHFSHIIKIRFTHDAETELLTHGKKVTLFRIVQEQLKNILKHSSAKQVDIYLQSKEGNTQLIIKDDGVGFDPHQTHNGIGLSNIHERARFYNGSVEIQTAPGNGCTLVVTIPSFE